LGAAFELGALYPLYLMRPFGFFGMQHYLSLKKKKKKKKVMEFQLTVYSKIFKRIIWGTLKVKCRVPLV
jgi:hypothetical protein